jgi:TatD DNase family protein
MKYIDIHTHHPLYDTGTLAIRNLLNPDTLEKNLAVPGYYSIGIHPWHIHPDHWQEDVVNVEKWIHHPQVLAIGEAGLDRLTDLPLDIQTMVFKSMVMLSEQSQKPLIIHSVRTHQEILLLHRQLLPSQPWILHGFNLRWTIAEAFIDAGFYLSFGSAILHHQTAATNSFVKAPMSSVFLETDEAQIDIREIYRRAAELKGLREEDLLNNIEERFRKIMKYEGS